MRSVGSTPTASTPATVRAEGGGYTLEVSYPSVSRPALASPFEIMVTRPGGFDGPVTLAVTRDYLKMWDENGLVPAPAGETTAGEWVRWEFEPPDGDELTVFYDARIEPAVQSGRTGRVAVIDDGERVRRGRVPHRGAPVVEIIVRASVIFAVLLRADPRHEATHAGRHGAVRAAVARHARRHHPAGHHPGGLLGHRGGAGRVDVRVLDHGADLRHVALAAGRVRHRRRPARHRAGRHARSSARWRPNGCPSPRCSKPPARTASTPSTRSGSPSSRRPVGSRSSNTTTTSRPAATGPARVTTASSFTSSGGCASRVPGDGLRRGRARVEATSARPVA